MIFSFVFLVILLFVFFFFFQAEDGIRDADVTGVQTCALPIFIKNFMVQGGMVKETFPPIKGEFNSNGVKNDLKHYRGVISMARTMVPNSATSQFFIVHKTSSHLDGEYAGFGGLISGFDVLDALASVKTGGSFDAPLNEVLIESIVVDLRGYESK